MNKWVYKLAHPILVAYWFVFRPKTFGVKCVLRHGNKVVLIKNTYGSGKWNLPGGGMKRGESGEQAVAREVREELGIVVGHYPIRLIGEVFTTDEYKRDTVYVYEVEVEGVLSLRSDGGEVQEAKWFEIGELPGDISGFSSKVLAQIAAGSRI